MDFKEYSSLFEDKAIKNGYPEQVVKEYLSYAENLFNKNLPIIYDVRHFAGIVGYSTKYIVRAVTYTKYFYRTFKIAKKNGKKRVINEPLPSLKEIQLWINLNLLSKVKPSKFAKAYIRNKNTVDNAKYHKNKKYVLCLDLKDFFPSISLKTIELFFKSLGYTNELANLFAKLCCFDNYLAQGAPTSPTLSNLILRDFDEYVGNFAVDNNLRYTRYADDITISYNDEFDSNLIITYILNGLKLIKHSNLLLNTKKTQLLTPNKRQIVTGIVTNEKLQAPITYRKQIRLEIYFIKKFGLTSHLNKINETRSNYLYHLLGKINYCISINPSDKLLKNYRDIVIALINN
ncbi:reverse transcriptase family protein [Sphingobacterium daejeonense]|uniref:reverse transcriptase family protein n=1 Tax=Sphingobacterium daejeonense TaxID=371142 RepID=UPI0021A822FB|nr:reverse transcriptase family protein [Sphingobacterium daejeonense]MCT1529967.1 reverse transcriptase family protein [Sphingobacterium daejeonense]